MKLFTLLALLIAITAGLFALQNATPVFVQFLGWQTQSSMALILLVTFALGVLFGFLISLPTMIQRMRKIAHFRSQAEQLAYDLDVANRKLSEAGVLQTDHPTERTQPHSVNHPTPA
jgi:putative membrane protein